MMKNSVLMRLSLSVAVCFCGTNAIGDAGYVDSPYVPTHKVNTYPELVKAMPGVFTPRGNGWYAILGKKDGKWSVIKMARDKVSANGSYEFVFISDNKSKPEPMVFIDENKKDGGSGLTRSPFNASCRETWRNKAASANVCNSEFMKVVKSEGDSYVLQFDQIRFDEIIAEAQVQVAISSELAKLEETYSHTAAHQRRVLTSFEKNNPPQNCNSYGWCDDKRSKDNRTRIANARRGTQESCTTGDSVYDTSYPLSLVSFHCPSFGEVTTLQMAQYNWKFSNVDRMPAAVQLGFKGVVISIVFEKK